MKTLIICHSVHHGNTWKVARAIARELDADLIQPEQFRTGMLDQYDLVGFGSGIYIARFHHDILDLIADLPHQNGKKAFVFSTAGNCCEDYHFAVVSVLHAAGLDVVAEFSCEGYDTYRFPGQSVNSGRPDDADLERARQFARDVRDKVTEPVAVSGQAGL
ncbi:MAG: flavodoxin family protein [candidate division WOR-3 bacterium]|nr:MAG: flavodoxin family protein [candidate division WOR-3 bacterium]